MILSRHLFIYVCFGVLPAGFLAGLPSGLFEEALNDLTESPSPAPGVGDRSLSKEETLVKLFSLTRGECTSGVAEREPAGVSFWTLLPVVGFFFLLRSELEAVLPRRTCPPTGPSSSSAVGVVLRDDVRELEPDRTLPLRVRFGSLSRDLCRWWV